jgi:hypothetical protein
MDLGGGIWNVKSLYRAGSLSTVASEMATYKLDLVAVKQNRWVKGGRHPSDDLFFYGNGDANQHFGTVCCLHNGYFISSQESRTY